MELKVVAGQDPGQLEADMTHAEDRHRRYDAQRLEEHGDLPAAALDAVLEGCFVGEVGCVELGHRIAGE